QWGLSTSRTVIAYPIAFSVSKFGSLAIHYEGTNTSVNIIEENGYNDSLSTDYFNDNYTYASSVSIFYIALGK
ncbi:hypothetical protein, partial [Pectinatus frisingensis]|uniref:hypothetical protein n=1 Tax=Pectinatus frisingensis TaxID=865 RepID=UPI001E282A1F